MKKNIFILLCFMSFALLTNQSWAENKYTIKEMTPAVQAALDGRKDRFEPLSELKKKGLIGENNQGYVEVLVKGQGAEESAAAENKDRQVIYQTIADQNGLKDELSTIEKVFAEVQRDKAQPGEKIQNTDGSWATK